MTQQSGGSAGYPGVATDGNNGLLIQGTVVALQGVQQLSDIFAGTTQPVASGVETNLGPYSGQIQRNPPFRAAPVDGVDNMGFQVPLSVKYRHSFSIPVHAGSTGGDIEVRAMQDGFAVETWVFTVLSDVKTVLNGFQVDSYDVSDVLWFALFQNTGSAWSINAQPLVELAVL